MFPIGTFCVCYICTKMYAFLATRQSSCVTARGVLPAPLASGFTAEFTCGLTSGFTSSAISRFTSGGGGSSQVWWGVPKSGGGSPSPVPGPVGRGPPVQVWWGGGPLLSSPELHGRPPCGQTHKVKTLPSHTFVCGR